MYDNNIEDILNSIKKNRAVGNNHRNKFQFLNLFKGWKLLKTPCVIYSTYVIPLKGDCGRHRCPGPAMATGNIFIKKHEKNNYFIEHNCTKHGTFYAKTNEYDKLCNVIVTDYRNYDETAIVPPPY